MLRKMTDRCGYDQGRDTERRWRQVVDTVIAIPELRSDCVHRAPRRRKHEWEEKDRWVGVDCDRRGLTGKVS